MTSLAPNDRRSGPYLAEAGQVDFPADFPLFDAEDIAVFRWRQLVAGSLTEDQLEPNAFEIVNLTDEGFTVRLVVPALEGDLISIAGMAPVERAFQFAGGTLRLAALTGAFDRLVVMVQELRRDVARAALVPIKEEYGPDLPPFEVRGDTLWIWTPDGSGVRYDRTLTQFDADVAEVRADTVHIDGVKTYLDLLRALVDTTVATFTTVTVPAAVAAVVAARDAAIVALTNARDAGLTALANTRDAALTLITNTRDAALATLQAALNAALAAVDAETDERVDERFAEAGLQQPANSNYDWAIADPVSKKVVIGYTNGDLQLMHSGKNANTKELFNITGNVGRARPVRHGLSIGATKTQRGLVITYGQSLEVSEKSNTQLTGALRADCFMIGQAVRPAGKFAGTFDPQGGALVATPLKATVDNSNANAGIAPRTDAEIAAAPLIASRGEAPVVALTMELARAWADQPGYPSRKWFAVSCGVGGQKIADLQKGAATGYYGRYISALDKFCLLAEAAGETKSVSVIAYMQGEDDYNQVDGTRGDKDAHRAQLEIMIPNLVADAKARTGQTEDPVVLLYQTSGNWINDTCNLAITQAQLEYCWSHRGVYCVGPNNFVTDNRDGITDANFGNMVDGSGDSHLDANGYRWFGLHMARVAVHVLVDRLHWEPFAPRAITRTGRTIYVQYHVPKPPLQFRDAYNGHKTSGLPTHGFFVKDLNGVVPISPGGVEIIGGMQLAITVDRDFVFNVDSDIVVQSTQDASANGNNELFDSWDAYTPFQYTYIPNYGQTLTANIPELVNKPYPMFTKSCEWILPVGWSR